MDEQPQQGQVLSWVSTASDDSVWGIDPAGVVLQYTAATKEWQKVLGAPQLKQLSVGSAQNLWGVTRDGKILHCSGSGQGWQPVQGELSMVSTAADGTVWGVNSSGQIYRYVGGAQVWEQVPGELSQVSVGSAQNVWGVNRRSASVFRYVGGAQIWEQVPGSQQQVSLGADGAPWAIDASGRVCLYTGVPNYWYQTSVPLRQLSVGGTQIWGIQPDGTPIALPADPIDEQQPASTPSSDLPGTQLWETESVFDESRSTHLWIVNRATELARQDPTVGQWLFDLVKPGQPSLGDGFHDSLCRGLYAADWTEPYNDPTGLPGSLKYSYKSHFYDPDSQTNWRGETDPTALTRGRAYFAESRDQYFRGNLTTAAYYLGLSLHYLTDLTQPMHSSNFTWLDSDVWGFHGGFETYTLQIQGQVTPPSRLETSGPGAIPDKYFITAAVQSKQYSAEICNGTWAQNYRKPDSPPDSVWQGQVRPLVVRTLLPNAIQITAQYLVAWAQSVQPSHAPKIYVFHQESDKQGSTADKRLLYSVYDGVSWQRDQRLYVTSTTAGPAAVQYAGKLYCLAAENGVLWNAATTGGDWSINQVPATRISAGPSAVVYQDRLYCFHQGDGNNGQLWYNAFDGTNWAGDRQVPATRISAGPSAVVYQDRLYCFHQGDGNNGQLWYNVFDGTNWAGDTQVPATRISAGPSAVVYQDRLYCFHQGDGNNGQLWYNAFDGTNWAGDTQVPGTRTSQSPSAVVYNGRVYCFHHGDGNNGQLWYNAFDGANWAGDTQIANVGITGGPGATLVAF